ncbi:tetratricopeptide repeat protein 19, mitochondrial isoform X3 [Microcebus murinus]|uniref:tetratricopeptide repeat protein 19, mitochondrial isoform X3 n=1 Tax=Microcebus murinus TaxID=30608 RepID=UPI00098B66EA|nr:tetratricopeptide repeat protein 19, mitochondrial isoform X3 [Microcebus murinus]
MAHYEVCGAACGCQRPPPGARPPTQPRTTSVPYFARSPAPRRPSRSGALPRPREARRPWRRRVCPPQRTQRPRRSRCQRRPTKDSGCQSGAGRDGSDVSVRHCACGGNGDDSSSPRPDQSGERSARGGAPGLGQPAVRRGRGGSMYRLLSRSLGGGLLRAAGRRCRGCSVRTFPVLAGGPGPEVQVPPSRVAPHGGGPGLLPLLAALAWFSRPAAAEKEEQQGADGAAAEDEAEAEIIQLLKRAKLSILKDEPEEAELILHDALRLAYQMDNKKAITYTYDLMANLAFIRGQLENAEQLFKATMSYLLGGGMKQEDNAIIEISLKLASIYAAQNRQEFALAGYEFCISTLEEKIEREKELAEDILSVEEKANTHLLLGMCLDACARYLLFSKQPSQAQRMYEKALQISEEIQGERHPQTIVLMSDLATTLDAQGHFDEAYIYMQRASDLARQINHPELHMVLSNLAAVLMHRDRALL